MTVPSAKLLFLFQSVNERAGAEKTPDQGQGAGATNFYDHSCDQLVDSDVIKISHTICHQSQESWEMPLIRPEWTRL